MSKKWILLGVLLVALFTAPLYMSNYILHIGIITLMFAFSSQAWNIISGYSGQFSFGHAAFFGVGAYTSTVLLVEYGVTPWIGMFVGSIMAMLIAFFIGYLTFRYNLRGAYFSLSTLAFAEILRVTVKNTDFFRKTMGIMIPLDIDPIMYQFQTRAGYYYTILILTIIITVIVYFISKSRLGFNLVAIRENEDAAQSLGVRTFKNKMIAIMLSGGLTAFAGTFYAQYLLFVKPEITFGSDISVSILMPAIVGGVGTVVGPIIGSFIVTPLGELTSTLFSNLAGTNLIAYGLIVILIIIFMPEGVVGRYNDWKSKRLQAKSNSDEDSVKNEGTVT